MKHTYVPMRVVFAALFAVAIATTARSGGEVVVANSAEQAPDAEGQEKTDDQETETNFNPTALCIFHWHGDTPNDQITELTGLKNCILAGLAHPAYDLDYGPIDPLEPLRIFIDPNDPAAEVPSLAFSEADPDIQSVTVRVDDGTGLTGRIDAFLPGEPPLGGQVDVEINGVLVSVTTTGLNGKQLMTALRTAINNAGFTTSNFPGVAMLPILILDDGQNNPIYSLKLRTTDPGLVTTGLSLEPLGLP